MNSEIINILNDNCVQQFDLINNLEEYIEAKHQDYLTELQENNFEILPWRRLELITAYKNNALIYEDVPEYIKEKHNLPSRDEGIDVIKITNGEIEKVYQCKCYTTKMVTKSKIESFYKYKQQIYNLGNVEFIVVGSSITRIHKNINQLKYDINEDFGEYPQLGGNKKEIKLRYYQDEAIKRIKQAYYNDEIDTINIKIPCGCGKTQLIYHYSLRNYRILILVPKISIAEQIRSTFRHNYKKKINCYWTDTRVDNNSNVTLCVYNSLDKIINHEFDITFIDEAHHIILPEKYRKIYNQMNDEEYIDENANDCLNLINKLKTKLKVNLSATIDVDSEQDYEYKFEKAINEGYLTDYEINILYVDSLFNNSINNDYTQIVNIINENKEYKHIIIYCNRIETTRACCETLNNSGIISYDINSEMRLKERRRKVEDFKNGLVRVICSVNCLSEGVDLPIADTCMFLNDRQGEINVIQCVGRILRPYQYKPKARIVLFDVNATEANNKGDFYLRLLNKYDNFARKGKLNRKVKIYDHTSNRNVNIVLKESIYFDKILKFRLTWDQKLELCKEYIAEYGNKWPSKHFVYKNWHIGNYIMDIKFDENSSKRKIIETLFNNTLIIKSQLSNKELLELNQKFYDKFGRLPKAREVFEGYKIGGLIHRIINQNQHEDIKEDLENIYGVKLETKYTKHVFSDEEIIKYNKQFYEKFKRLPKQIEVIGEFKIGKFINRLKSGQFSHLKKEIESIYSQTMEPMKNMKQYEAQDDESKFKLCKEFYDKFGRLPNPSKDDAEEAGFNIYDFVNNTLRSSNANRRETIINIFELTDEDLNKTKRRRVMNEEDAASCIEAVVEYYKTHHRLPTNSRQKVEVNGIDITNLSLDTLRGRGVGVYIRKALEKEGYKFEPKKVKEIIFSIEEKIELYDKALSEKQQLKSTNKTYKYVEDGKTYEVNIYDCIYDIKNKRTKNWEQYLPFILEVEQKHGIVEKPKKQRSNQEQQIEMFKKFYELNKREPVKYEGKDKIKVIVNGEEKEYDIGARYKNIMKPAFIKKNQKFVDTILTILNKK